MHLPFMQVANEVLDYTAPEVAALLDWDEAKAFVGLVRLFRWALARCPENLPPSACDVVQGPAAAKLIARAAGWTGAPESFLDACEQSSHPILERVPGGVRVRGLDRYDQAFAKNNPALWKQWKEAQASSSAGTGPEPARNRAESEPEPSEHRPEPGRQTQMQIQKESKTEPSTSSTGLELAIQELPGVTLPDAGLRVFEHWRRVMRKSASARYSDERREAVEDRLKDGFTPEQLCRAVDGCAASPWHMGQNDRGKAFNDLELICRDTKRVEGFIEAADNPPPKPNGTQPDTGGDPVCVTL